MDNTDNNQYRPMPNGFSTASLVLGIIALCLSCCFYLSIPCAALAILFALLSKGSDLMMNGRAKLGLGFGIAGFVATVLGLIILFVTYFATNTMTDFSNTMEDYFNYCYGEDSPESQELEDMLENWQNQVPQHSQNHEGNLA